MKKIPVINGIRGVAILAVIAYHVRYPFVGGRVAEPLLSLGGKTILHFGFMQNGQMAVYLFFIISGFVLALPYATGTRTMATQEDALFFYKKRALRLMPLYYFHLALLVTIHNNLPTTMGTIMRDVFLMGTATFHFVPWMWFPKYNGILWSIGSEIWFCVLMPGVLWSIRRYGLFRTMCIVGFFSILMQWWGAVVLGAGANYVSDNVLGDAFYFCLGITAAYAHVRYRFRRPFMLTMTGGVLIGMSFLLQDRMIVGEWHLRPSMFPMITTLFSVGSTALILGLIHVRSTVLQTIFANRPLQLVGMMSYSLYLWHPMAIPMYMNDMTPMGLSRMTLMLALVGWFSYRYIEFGRVKGFRELLPEKATTLVAA